MDQTRSEVKEQRRALRTLRERFNRPDAPRLTAWLINYRHDTVPLSEACEATYYVAPDEVSWHSAKGAEFSQEIYIHPVDSAEIGRFVDLATEADNLLGAWAGVFGVGNSGFGSGKPFARWIYALFELKWAKAPGIPYETRVRDLANQRITMLRLKRRYDNSLTPEGITEVNREIEEAKSLGYYAGIKNLYEASVYAIDVIVHGNIYSSTFAADPNDLRTPTQEELREVCRDTLLRRYERIVSGQHPDWPIELIVKEAIKRTDEHEMRLRQTRNEKAQAKDAEDAGHAAATQGLMALGVAHTSCSSSTPFAGGAMVFFEDRVELCGVDICSGPRSKNRREILNLLREVTSNGEFRHYSELDITEALAAKGVKIRVAGAINKMRIAISQQLREDRRIDCRPDDVIVTNKYGYQFSRKLSVQDSDSPPCGVIRDAGCARHVPDVPDGSENDVPNVPDDGFLAAATDESGSALDATLADRRDWIIQELTAGRNLRPSDVASRFQCSLKTAKRDFDALRDQGRIKFFGSARAGKYGLLKPPESASG